MWAWWQQVQGVARYVSAITFTAECWRVLNGITVGTPRGDITSLWSGVPDLRYHTLQQHTRRLHSGASEFFGWLDQRWNGGDRRHQIWGGRTRLAVVSLEPSLSPLKVWRLRIRIPVNSPHGCLSQSAGMAEAVVVGMHAMCWFRS